MGPPSHPSHPNPTRIADAPNRQVRSLVTTAQGHLREAGAMKSISLRIQVRRTTAMQADLHTEYGAHRSGCALVVGCDRPFFLYLVICEGGRDHRPCMRRWRTRSWLSRAATIVPVCPSQTVRWLTACSSPRSESHNRLSLGSGLVY